MSFDNLKKNSAKLFEDAQKAVAALANPTFEKDPDDWYPETDKLGNGYAVIRFLPRIDEDDVDFCRWWSHEFQDKDTKKWYIENCLFTLGQGADPVMEFNKKLWDSVPGLANDPAAKAHPNRQQATRQGRKVHFRSNIFIKEDTINPENNGKAKKFKYGKWAMDKIEAVMNPKFAADKKINPFDLWEGADFIIKIVSERKDGKLQRKYDNSIFAPPGPLADDKTLRKIYDSYKDWSVKAYVAPDKFKSYADLKKRLDEVVGYDTGLWNGKALAPSSSVRQPEYRSEEPKTSATLQRENITDESNDFFNSLKDDIPF